MDPRALLIAAVIALGYLGGVQVVHGVKHAAHKIVHVLKKGDK